MSFEQFCNISHALWDERLKWCQYQFENKILTANATPIYPQFLLCTKTEEYFAAELVGASLNYAGLTVKQRRQSTIAEYLGQFEGQDSSSAAFEFDSSGSCMAYMCLTHTDKFDAASAKFPIVEKYPSRIVRTNGNPSCLLSFGRNFRDMSIYDSLLLNTNGKFLRAKHIFDITVVSNSLSLSELRLVFRKKFEALETAFKTIPGVLWMQDAREMKRSVAAQLQNLFLTPTLHETTIGAYFEKHPDVICKALGIPSFIYEPTLRWEEGASDPTDTAINPDMLIARDDGLYDILDFKTALLNRGCITKGEAKRRSFVSPVHDGIAQLHHYAEYFTFPKNAEYARNKFGVKVSDPNLFLIVGNADNADAREIEQALRPYKTISIVDYDSIIQMYLSTSA